MRAFSIYNPLGMVHFNQEFCCLCWTHLLVKREKELHLFWYAWQNLSMCSARAHIHSHSVAERFLCPINFASFFLQPPWQ